MSSQGEWPQAIERLPDGGYKLAQTAQSWEMWQTAWESAIAHDRQQRGEAVARVNDDGFIVETGLSLAPGTKLYAAPQPVEPTKEMLDAARDWSYKKYGKAMGDDAAIGCWKAMQVVAAQPSVPDAVFLGCARMGLAEASDEEMLNYVRVATQRIATPTPPAAGQADAERPEWMTCESRGPWVTNSLKHHIKELRVAEKRSRHAFKKDYMGEPARYFADVCGEAAVLFESRLSAIDAARAQQSGGK